MSAGELLSEILNTCRKLLLGTIGWLVVAPIARIAPRRRDCVAVIGRDNGKFVDNAKYFLLQSAPLLAPYTRVAFVTERPDVPRMLTGTSYEVLTYPSWRGAWFLLRAGTVVVDSSEWVWKFRRFLLVGSRKLQLWHGVGYKRIELDKWKQEATGTRIFGFPWMPWLRRIMKIINGRLVRFDAVATTSSFYTERVFKPALMSRHFVISGYPRNAFGTDSPANAIAWVNVDSSVVSHINEWVRTGRRLVLVTPTYRDSRATQMGLDADTISMLDHFCEREKVEFVFKFHPLERKQQHVQGDHLHVCDPDSDLYPLMPLSHALVTDYSSIYMDYLVLDKPVFFLVPDLQEYTHRDRQIQFDFNEMTPGPKVDSWRELTASLSAQWRHDTFVDERARLSRLAFDDLPQAEAVPTLLAFMREHGWIPGTFTKAANRKRTCDVQPPPRAR